MKKSLFIYSGSLNFLAYVVDSVFSQPVERLEKQKNGEKCDEFRIEVISKHSKCEAGFGERIPETLHQVLKLSGT